MTDGILVASANGREAWAFDASKSITRPHVVVYDHGYELGKLHWVLDNTNWGRVIFLQDSMIVLDNGVFDRIAETPGSICLCHYHQNHLSCYLGVYETSMLRAMRAMGKLPFPTSKEESVHGEWHWTVEYLRICGGVTCFDERQEWGPVERRHGRPNVPHHMGYAIKFRDSSVHRDIPLYD